MLLSTLIIGGFSLLAPCSADADTEKRFKILEDEIIMIKDTVKDTVRDTLKVTVKDTVRDELEERVRKLEDLAKIGTLRSCAEYAKFGLRNSGPYLVDPDGSLIGQAPFQVQT